MEKNRSSVSYSVNAKVNFRVMIVGESAVGKTSMIIRFVKGSFSRFGSPPSVGIEFYSKNIDIGDEQISLQLWDTAGQQNFKSLAKSFYNQSSCIIIAYSNPTLYKKTCQFYALQINEHAKDGVKVIVARTQIDQKPVQFCQTEQQKEYLDQCANKNMILFWSGISSKTGENIDTFFNKMAQELYGLYLKDEHFKQIVDPKKNSIILEENNIAQQKRQVRQKKKPCC